MIKLTEAKIKEIIAKKKAELDQLIIDVNAAIARKNGEITALTDLIEPDPPAEEEAVPTDQNGKAPAKAKSDPSKRPKGQTSKA